MTLLGHAVYVTTAIPITGGAGTNESRISWRTFSKWPWASTSRQFTVLTETFGNWDQIALRIVCRMDIAPLNPAGVVVLTGVTP